MDVEGSAEAQKDVQALFSKLTESDDREISPFDTAGWENLLDLVARRLSSRGLHITKEALNEGAEVKSPGTDLAVYSMWGIYGRPRSENIREQDLERLREKIDKANDDSELPPSLRGYVVPAPDKSAKEQDDWGLTQTSLSGITTYSGGAGDRSDCPVNRTGRNLNEENYFFPLQYNEEQAQIIDLLDSEEVQVVSVTGPPGTGKTHTIANIIGHFMATGRRVLVTARTPEAIAAVRDKLPEDLASLVIASVASDREGAKQMEDAIQRLSDDVLSLNVKETQEDIERLQTKVLHIDDQAQECDRRLAEIAEQNLAQLHWAGEMRTAMELAEILAELEPTCGWLSDRPAKAPPEGLEGVVDRLRSNLPRLGSDLVYLGVDIPALLR